MISARSENELFASYLRNHCGLPTLYGNGDVAAARLCRRDDHVRWVTPDVRAPFRSWSLACLGPSTNKAKQKMSALAPADAFRAQGQVVTPFSSAIKRSAGAARRARAEARRCACFALPSWRRCVPRATAVVLFVFKHGLGLFFAVLCIYSRGRFRSASGPGS